MHRLKQWMISATAEEIRELFMLADTSREYLYHISNGHRQPSAYLAGRITDAANEIREREPRARIRLPVLGRVDLCLACAHCPHALACSKK